MKKILLVSPIAFSQERSGISIRLEQLCLKYKGLGLRTKLIDNIRDVKREDFIYIMISTKKESISFKVATDFQSKASLIVDLYTPIFLEKEAYLTKWKPQDWYIRAKMKSVVKKIIRAGDFFIVANTRQKEYWLKVAKALKAPIEQSKIFVLPTGAPKPPAIKRKTSNVILWFGGIYPWLDPTPLIESFSKIASGKQEWKLRILGGFHPNTGYEGRFKKIVSQAKNKIKPRQLQIIPWQNSKDMLIFLNDVNFAVHLPRETREDFCSHRVRLLTLLNSGVPIITTGNDIISNLLNTQKAGIKIARNNLSKNLKLAIGNQPLVNSWSRNAHGVQGKFIKSQEEFSRFKSIFKTNEG